MADTVTPVLGLVKPEINGAQTENVWGFDINSNFDKIDARFGTSISNDAPQDALTYGRHLGAWEAVAPLYSPALTGFPTAPTPPAGDNDTSIATTAFVTTALVAAGSVVPSNALPLAPGTPNAGTSELYSRGDHVHPSDTTRVAKTGDTMTGDLTISKANPQIFLAKAADGQGAYIHARNQTSTRWVMHFPSATLETGGNAGSDFALGRYNDLGVFIDQPLFIKRSTGAVAFGGTVTFAGAAAVAGYNGAIDGAFISRGNIAGLAFEDRADPTKNSMWYRSGNFTTLYDSQSGPVFSISNAGVVNIPSTTASTSPTTGALTVAGGVGIGGSIAVGGAIGLGRNPGAGGFLYTSNSVLGYSGLTIEHDSTKVTLNHTVVGSGNMIYFYAAGVLVGSITNTASAVAYNTSSSAELKEDLQSFDAGRIIDDTEVYDFKWKDIDARSYGIIAQQAVEVYPQAITHDEKEDWWGVDYSKYVPVLLQELKAVRARLAALEGKPVIDPKKGR